MVIWLGWRNMSLGFGETGSPTSIMRSLFRTAQTSKQAWVKKNGSYVYGASSSNQHRWSLPTNHITMASKNLNNTGSSHF